MDRSPRVSTTYILGVVNERADAAQDNRTYFARPNYRARTGTEKINLYCSADLEQDCQLYSVGAYYSAGSIKTTYTRTFFFFFFGCSDGMEREACVCDHGFERSDLCAEIIIIIIIITHALVHTHSCDRQCVEIGLKPGDQ